MIEKKPVRKATFTFWFNGGERKIVCDVVYAKEENNIYWMKQEDGTVIAVNLHNVLVFSYKDPFASEESIETRRERYNWHKAYQKWKEDEMEKAMRREEKT